MDEKNSSHAITEKTPSKSEYFSWINNTNEGSTEEQTLANLDFFAYLKKTYNMRLDIYAWDAGNLDGAADGYDFEYSEKIKKQFPRGYKPIVDYAKKQGVRMGVWGGADGYGNDEKTAEKRRAQLVKLCRDYNFALFKFDAVCGALRAEKRNEFAKTMRECRKYAPDLILLNHRNDLGDASGHATTFLWEGMETYVDVHGYNGVTAPHNRAYMFFRGHTPGLKRLTEDHGVCLSSSLDAFDDDLIYQAFNRCLILAPEIYGNPWFLRDDEYASLARIFNLHRRFADILVDGMLPETFLGDNAVIRGDKKRRFLATGNASWKKITVELALNEKSGLERCERVCVISRFPTEKFLGEFAYGEKTEICIEPFRAALIEFCDSNVCDEVIVNAEYTVLHEDEKGNIDKVSVLKSDPKTATYKYNPKNGEKKRLCLSGCAKLSDRAFDFTKRAPEKIGELADVENLSGVCGEFLYETACFSADNFSLERRSALRAGKSKIKEVERARKLFFEQNSYKSRGLEPSVAFNGGGIFDVKSRAYYNHDGRKGFRVGKGCLRVDLGETVYADRIEIEYFVAAEENVMFEKQNVETADFSADLKNWHKTSPQITSLCKTENEFLYYYCDTPGSIKGTRTRASFKIGADIRYFRLKNPIDRIYSVKVFSAEPAESAVESAAESTVEFGGSPCAIKLKNPALTNLFAHYDEKITKAVQTAEFTLKNLPQNPYIAVAFDGVTGEEGVMCVAEIDGEIKGFPSRAPAFPSNAFEYPVRFVNGNYTFFLPLKKADEGKKIKITAVYSGNKVPATVYVCDKGVCRGIDLQTDLNVDGDYCI